MSNFDFLKNFNDELYKLGVKLEEDVLDSPRAVTADATLFLETLVKDIYRQANIRLENHLISFYKKIDYLYRQGAITYIYKNKLQDAYNLRNKIHKNYQNAREEMSIAFDLHKRLYYISTKYFRDYCDNERYVNIPEYRKPVRKDFKFDNCIICGCDNRNSPSNMCNECNGKIENANLLMTIKNSYGKSQFTRFDLIESGISESESVSLLMNLTRKNILVKKGPYYTFNDENFNRYIEEIDQYVEIALLLSRFYNDEITSFEIKKTREYWRGSKLQKPCIEFYNLVNAKIERDFEKDLIKTENITRSMKNTSMDNMNIKSWFSHESESFINGRLNDAFILFNELLIKEYFDLKRKGLNDRDILSQLEIPKDFHNFWRKHFMGKDFMKKTSEIKKDMIIKEIKKNKTLAEALKYVGISRKEFDKLYVISKNHQDEFHRQFDMEYTHKRQKLVIKHLKNNNLNAAIRKSRITKNEFLRWYYRSEVDLSAFYIKTTEILMEKYLKYRKNGLNKKDILKQINISRDMFQSWSRHDDLDLYKDFERKNSQITSFLIKRGLIINALKDDKSKEEAIFSAGLTPSEFLEIYNTSKRENSEFHIRFEREYVENRKRLFAKLIPDNDFFNAINKCEISQIDFNKWYLKDQDKFLTDYKPSEFYLQTTLELMDKYINERMNGKNKPDSARSVGLSNTIITRWLNHPEYELYYDFKKRINRMTVDLIVKGFGEGKSKEEVSNDYDVALKTIEKYIELGRNGFMKYEEIFQLYEEQIVPRQLETFLEDIKTKSLSKSLKHSKISRKDLDYYYELGNDSESPFCRFHDDYLETKIGLYVDNILAQKSSRIALKNSNLTREEFSEHKDEIDDEIFMGRIRIIGDELIRHPTTGAKIAKKLGIGVDELYSWYFKGRKGDEKFKGVYRMLELGMIYPRVAAYSKAEAMGIPRNWLHKKIKKDLGAVDYKIWKKNGLLDNDYFNHFKIDDLNEDERRIIDIMKSSADATVIEKESNPELYGLMRKAILSNQKENDGVNVLKK